MNLIVHSWELVVSDGFEMSRIVSHIVHGHWARLLFPGQSNSVSAADFDAFRGWQDDLKQRLRKHWYKMVTQHLIQYIIATTRNYNIKKM